MKESQTVADSLARAIEKHKFYDTLLKERYPEAYEIVKEIDSAQTAIDNAKKGLKKALMDENDYDMGIVSTSDGKKYKYSLTKVVRLEVSDIEQVPDEFKSVQEVADEKKAQNYYKLMGEPPEGFKDVSYCKLNFGERNG